MSVILLPPPLLPSFQERNTEEVNAALAFAKEGHAKSTKRAYESDIKRFMSWCDERKLAFLPATPETVSVFIAFEAGQNLSPLTLSRRIAAIRYFHQLQGFPSPTTSEIVKATMKGIKRTIGIASNPKAAATVEVIRDMLRVIPKTLRGTRDRAILLLGFAGAFRRSELSSLTLDDLIEAELGYRILIRKSKTDQEGKGQEIAIYNGKLKTIEAVKEWIEASHITEGYLFRPLTKGGKVLNQALAPHRIAQVVKRYAEKAGYSSGNYAGHSLRSGFITSAAENGACIFKMMEVSRHKSVETLKGYVRRAELFKDHAGTKFL
jgi:site-specific recombinase XerD